MPRKIQNPQIPKNCQRGRPASPDSSFAIFFDDGQFVLTPLPGLYLLRQKNEIPVSLPICEPNYPA